MPKSTTIENIARGLLWHGQAILVCRNIKHGYYYLPGGHIEPGEPAAEALRREILEETGETVTIGPLLFACEVLFTAQKRAHHEFNLVFHVELLSKRASVPKIASKEAGIGFEWLDQAAVVDVDLRPAAIRAWIASGCTAESNPVGWVATRE